MTADLADDRRVRGSAASVRQRWRGLPATTWWLLGILAATTVVGGARILAPFYVRGDLLYHWGLANTIRLGSFPPEGPYLGLPAYYPPGFHVLLASVATALGTSMDAATALLGILWLPVIPLGAFLLTRRLTGRPEVAVVAAALTAFAGGFDLSPDRLWVNSMFMVGHGFYPIYPRDLVFGLMPFAMLAFLRATDGRRWSGTLAWAAIAGLLLGVAGLIQVQLLLPIPLALVGYVAVLGWRHRDRALRAVGALLATGIVAAALVGPWLAYIAGAIARNGGVSIESSEALLPARIGFWNYPIQFGLILPLAILGAGVVLLFLRRADGPRPDGEAGRWAPDPPEGATLLLPWWIVPWILAILYQPTWPLEDALRPQRMWLVASQPGLMLAAIGLVAGAEELVHRRPFGRRILAPVIVGAILVASLPTTIATERLLWTLWTDPRYAHLRLIPDRVPDMADLLPVDAPRPTVLTYEDWSSLVWYDTGAAVVAVEPPGYAKLAFDPAVFTGVGQPQRRSDLATALLGDPTALVAGADAYDADRIVLARRDDRLGLIGQPATVAADRADAVTGGGHALQGNGWDALVLEPGARLAIPVAADGGPIDLELRWLTEFALPAEEVGSSVAVDDEEGLPVVPVAGPGGTGRFRLLAGDRVLAESAVALEPGTDFVVVPVSVDLEPGETLVIEAVDRLALQSLTGFVTDPGPPAGWIETTRTDDAVVWERAS